VSLDTFSGGGSGGFSTSEDALGDAFYPLYGRLFGEDSDFIANVDEKLSEARMSDTVEMYVSRSLGIGVISGGLLWLVGVVVGYALFVGGIVDPTLGLTLRQGSQVAEIINAIKVPAMVFLTGLVLGSIGFGLGFGTLVFIPYSRSSARSREINMLLSDAVSFMYALSVGGLNQIEILRAMAQAEDTYGEVAMEFQSLVQETEYFDTDYRTAIRKQSMQTPSNELSQFLTDMLSIMNSGGDMAAFLDEKKDKHMRTAKQQQELTLETLELFGEMYMTLSLFPILLVIILVIMGIMGNDTQMMLLGTIYGLLPILGVGFMVLVATVKEDDPGDGILEPPDADERLKMSQQAGLLNLGLVEAYTGQYDVFDRIKSREGTYETVQILKAPHIFFRDNPLYTLAITVPMALIIVVLAVGFGAAPTSVTGVCETQPGWPEKTVSCLADPKADGLAVNEAGEKSFVEKGLVQKPVWGTFVYVYLPAYITLVPLTVFREWNVRSRNRIVNNLSDTLRKLSSANDTGQTLLESTKVVADTSSGKLATEFEIMYAKVNYGMSLRDSLIEFNNKYHLPRLARTVKLISKAQEASSQITQVLSTAAQSSENQDDIDRERKSRTRMQVVIIIMTFLTLLAVMAILKTQFLDVLAGLTEQAGGGSGGGGSFGASVNVTLLSLLFFHAVTMQAFFSGLISGYMRAGKVMSGLKFVVILITITLVAWTVVG
jgi:flagellar protein FlaJ